MYLNRVENLLCIGKSDVQSSLKERVNGHLRQRGKIAEWRLVTAALSGIGKDGRYRLD